MKLDRILLGHCLGVLKTLPDKAFDACVTDPPYGLGSKTPLPGDLMRFLQGESLDTGGDFMGKDWEVPSVSVWQEVYRVLKPGAYVLVFAGTRTWDVISMSLRMAGFENRDTIAANGPGLQWIQSQGMPKTKARALKPTWEPILAFRKPFKGSLARNVEKNGTGSFNIEACRIGGSATGRWPPNLTVEHSPECRVVGTKKVKTKQLTAGRRTIKWGVNEGGCSYEKGTGAVFATEDGLEEVEDWECAIDCVMAELDRQSGGKASRIFPQFKYHSKATKKESTLEGKIDLTAQPPTRKPVGLMRWLVKLVTPPNGTVLDPYSGSGTTLVAAHYEGFHWVGIEKDEKYHEAAVERLRLVGEKDVYRKSED